MSGVFLAKPCVVAVWALLTADVPADPLTTDGGPSLFAPAPSDDRIRPFPMLRMASATDNWQLRVLQLRWRLDRDRRRYTEPPVSPFLPERPNYREPAHFFSATQTLR